MVISFSLLAAVVGSMAAGGILAPGSAYADVAPRPFVSGSFGWWESDDVVQGLATNSEGAVSEASFQWWAFHGPDRPLCTYDNITYSGGCVEGTDTPWTTPQFSRQRDLLRDAGIPVFATLTDLDYSRAGQLSAYLSSPERRAYFARKITAWALKAGVDGVGLDFENFAFADDPATWEETRPRWVAFVRQLAADLHAVRLLLSVAVPAGEDPFEHDGAPNPGTGYWVYAWAQITPLVDQLRIMAYDYSFDSPGPIGPNDWAASVIDSAVEQVGERYADRIWIGDPQYGRDWPMQAASGWRTDASCPADWTPGSRPRRDYLTPASALALARSTAATPAWVHASAEWTFTYWRPTQGSVSGVPRSCRIKHEVWFADTRSALARASIAASSRIAGIAVWEFGSVAPRFYPALANFAREIAPLPVRVRIAAPDQADYLDAATIEVRVDTASGPVVGGSVRLSFTPAGSSTSMRAGVVSTDARGIARFGVTATQSGSWSARVRGDWEWLSGASARSAITVVRPWVSADARTDAAGLGRPIRVHAHTTPELPGRVMVLQRHSSRGWRAVATSLTDARGKATLHWLPSRAASYLLRVIVKPHDPYGRGISPKFEVRVTR